MYVFRVVVAVPEWISGRKKLDWQRLAWLSDPPLLSAPCTTTTTSPDSIKSYCIAAHLLPGALFAPVLFPLLCRTLSRQWMVVATCACGSPETEIRFLNPKGDCLAIVDTNQVRERFVKVGVLKHVHVPVYCTPVYEV